MCSSRCVTTALLTLIAAACSRGAETLVFDEPMAAVINARRWNETQQQWMSAED